MADTRVLLNGLVDYHNRLYLHVTQLQQEYQQLEVRWRTFRDVYEGDAAEQFKRGWEHTAAGFQVYIDETQQIMKILEERIGFLGKANQQEHDLL
jgi:uncharacterized protein YukE